MKRFQEWTQSLSTQDVMWMSAIFLASLMGTAVSGFILKWGLTEFGEMGGMARLAVTLGATVAYGCVVFAIFYAFFPETKLAFKRIWKK